MKKTLTVLFGMGALASVADPVTSQNTFGVLRVASRTAETIIAVPWQAAGGGEIAVADYVKTANLTAGDMLHAYDQTSGKFTSWVLGADKKWTGATSVTTEGVSRTADGKESMLARGKALVLVRQNPTAGDIFLYGEVSASAAKTTVEANAYNLITPALAEDVNLNEISMTCGREGTPTTSLANDFIRVDAVTNLQYIPGYGWGQIKIERGKVSVDTSCAVIKAGQGIVYISRGGAPTFEWAKGKGVAE